MRTVMMTEVAPKNLALRHTAAHMFEHAAFRDGEVELDFAGIESMGRAFAQEYLQLKFSHPRKVTEVNVPDGVRKMLDIVQNAKPKIGILTEKELLEEPTPLVIRA